MQPARYLALWLEQNTSQDHYLFTLQDFRALYPALSDGAFKTLLSRSVQGGYLLRICRGIYAYKKAMPFDGLLLYHVAALLRADCFNYISLETVLSDVGVISQIPLNWISIMSSGCSNTVSCGVFGAIEFIHTQQKPIHVMDQLSYDQKTGLWRAGVDLALRDMKRTRRTGDLIDRDMINEFI